ncbi:MAG: helix-turn-helix domain-containing protein [Proteobacteria bacterium]|jgi:hypothetical protein|nr:helix-turn-helix domain-containing protein [Pseudomonadota bacterium]
MKIPAQAERLLRGCWATLGLPLSEKPAEEHDVGIVDPEALLVSTLLVPGAIDSRLSEDIGAWCRVFGRLIHYQRLNALMDRLPEPSRVGALETARRMGLPGGSSRLATALGTTPTTSSKRAEAEARNGRIRSPKETAALSTFVNGRLFFGTGYRADLVSLTSIRRHVFGGPELARLLVTTPSTVSRLLSDLVACGFLDRRGRRRAPGDELPGLAVSADSTANIVAISDAQQVRDKALARTIEGECDFEWDRLGETLTSRGR